jgi:hypothetical protein
MPHQKIILRSRNDIDDRVADAENIEMNGGHGLFSRGDGEIRENYGAL